MDTNLQKKRRSGSAPIFGPAHVTVCCDSLFTLLLCPRPCVPHHFLPLLSRTPSLKAMIEIILQFEMLRYLTISLVCHVRLAALVYH